MRRSYNRIAFGAALFCFFAAVSVASDVIYRVEKTRPLSRFSARQLALLVKLNHVDAVNLGGLSKIVVPDRWDVNELQYSPMPARFDELADESKALVVDLQAQTFGAYEYGVLVRWGPVSSGDAGHQTPAGVYHLNWHAPVRISSENPTWIMPWYFNFSSDRGLALHQSPLPGRPASHGCVRLLDVDARWLYSWGDSWTVDEDTKQLVREGTLVFLLEQYNFAARQPWLNPKWWRHGVSLRLPSSDPICHAERSIAPMQEQPPVGCSGHIEPGRQ
jgi:L,D-transpeptidase catalytic domain